jgi:hypothetical protein
VLVNWYYKDVSYVFIGGNRLKYNFLDKRTPIHFFSTSYIVGN